MYEDRLGMGTVSLILISDPTIAIDTMMMIPATLLGTGILQKVLNSEGINISLGCKEYFRTRQFTRILILDFALNRI